jgi:hypothetical protein
VLFNAIEAISSDVRAKRLELNRLVTARKVSIREDIVMDAKRAFQLHIDQINTSLGGKARLPALAADFAGAIKGKKSISSLRDAADSELARAKISASQSGDEIRANLSSLVELAADHLFLFNDIQQLVLKANDDLISLIKVRISEHQKAEEVKAEALREDIRKQELQRIASEQEAERLAAIKPEPVAVVEPARPEPAAARAAPVQVTQSKPAAKPVTYQAEVTDFDALIKAVAYGQAPMSVLMIDWNALDAMVASQGSTFSMAGVTLARAAA